MELLPYEDALKVWAARRFGIDFYAITSVEVEEVPEGDPVKYSEVTWDSGEPAHLAVTIYGDFDGRYRSEKVEDTYTKVMYEIFHAGAVQG